MDLLDTLRSALLQQREDEVMNYFSNVADLREFISCSDPAAGVIISVKMCCYASERLAADNGTRVKGNVQLEGPVSDRIIEVHPSALKRKGG
ncbi:hypothetical protein PHMEG_00010188 [Phytophthora megakarya]|uniref:Uncharacterized protein n=1 Tax=Phytophthora megakarya TaxID=4795 RepID=A0A225WFA3_9STRA|nr:hypothetical protein PHMEG_00010188 [Phytophthora megakarya]